MNARGRWEMHTKFSPEKDKCNGLSGSLGCWTESSVKYAFNERGFSGWIYFVWLGIGSSVWFFWIGTAFWKTGNFLTSRVMVFSRRTLLCWVNSLHLSSAFPLRKFRLPSLVGSYDPDNFHHHRIEKDNLFLVPYKASILFIWSSKGRTRK
jgi:hypothetical protein